MDVAVDEDRGLDAMLGRDADFAEFFHAAWPRLYRTALGIAGDPGAAEDALQSAFAKAYTSWGRISGAQHPEAYLRRMVVNEILGVRRRAWWRRERTHGYVDDGSAHLGGHEGTVVDRVALWEAVQALPVRQRAVIVLRYYEDLTEAQIAEVLGCSPGTVKSQASGALANLRRTSGLRLADELEEGAR
jgi:RNA polymerase sigma-70 factor (sigma-E family)